MKNKLLLLLLIITGFAYSQTTSVNRLRIRNATDGNINNDQVLTIKSTGLVRQVPVSALASPPQNLSVTTEEGGNNVTISDGNTVFIPDNSNPSQTLSLNGTDLSISDGNTVTFVIGENDVALTNTYNNLKKLVPAVVDEGYVYIDNSGDYVFSFNGDNALPATSKLYDLQVGDSVFIQGVDGELGTLTITDYVFSDPDNLYLEFGAASASDFVDSNGVVIAENDPNFTDSNGVVQFRVLVNSFTETTPTVVGDVLNYLDENFIQYTASQGVQINGENIQLGGALTDNVQIDINNEIFRLRDGTDNFYRSDFSKNLIDLTTDQIDLEARGTTGTFFNPDLSLVSQGNIRMESRSNTQPFVIAARSDGSTIGFLINSETGDGDGSFTTYLTTGNDNKAFRYNGAVGQTVFSNPSDIVDKNYVDTAISAIGGSTPGIDDVLAQDQPLTSARIIDTGGNIFGYRTGNIGGVFYNGTGHTFNATQLNQIGLTIDASSTQPTPIDINSASANGTINISTPNGGLSINNGGKNLLTVNGTTPSPWEYNTDVTANIVDDNDIPNKKYVDDAVASTGGGGGTLSAWTNLTLEGDATATRARYRTKGDIVELELYGIRANTTGSNGFVLLPPSIQPTTIEDGMFVSGYNVSTSTACIARIEATSAGGAGDNGRITIVAGAGATDFLIFTIQYTIL